MIDWGRVITLRNEVGIDSFDEVVALFLEEVETATTRLRRPDAARNTVATARDLHFVKGAALNLGFVDLGAICESGERLAAAGARVDLEAVARLYDESRRRFLAGLDRARAA